MEERGKELSSVMSMATEMFCVNTRVRRHMQHCFPGSGSLFMFFSLLVYLYIYFTPLSAQYVSSTELDH